jgi:hypothetical protein
MSYFPDLSHESMVASGEHIRAIGWLHPQHEFPKCNASAEFLSRLKEFTARSSASAQALYFGASGGFHMCEFCDKAHGINNFGVPFGNILYVAPEMIVHYIEVHGYLPPAEFIAAVLRSPLPDTEDYQILTEPFWHLHSEAVRKLIVARGKD